MRQFPYRYFPFMRKGVIPMVIFTASLLLLSPLKAQERQFLPTIPPEPTAAALGKYGETPVNLSTGMPQISIPIYTLRGHRLSLPISLSYYSGGHRVSESASWVGLGWSLNAGGVINRQVNGLPDIVDNVGYFARGRAGNALVPPRYDDPAHFDKKALIKKYAEGIYDAEPDVFTFNFAGHTGKFILDADKQVKSIIPHMALKIDYTESAITPGRNDFDTFTITTEEGTRYTFSETITTSTKSECGGSSRRSHPLYRYHSSWYLTSITDASGTDTITLRYSAAYTLKTKGHYNESESAYLLGQSYNRYSESFCDASVAYTTVRLESIHSSKDEVRFSATTVRKDLPHEGSTPDRALDAILINPGSTSAHRKWNFRYSYFGTGTGVNVRLRLDEIQESGEALSIPPYTFDYDDSTVPPIDSREKDFWGYYNANGAHTLLQRILLYTATPLDPDGRKILKTAEGADRRPNYTAARFALLKRIGYPTGGYSTYAFEPNDFDPRSAYIPREDRAFVWDYDRTYWEYTGEDTHHTLDNIVGSDEGIKTWTFTLKTDQNIRITSTINGPFFSDNNHSNGRKLAVGLYERVDGGRRSYFQRDNIGQEACNNSDGCSCTGSRTSRRYYCERSIRLTRGTYYLLAQANVPAPCDPSDFGCNPSANDYFGSSSITVHYNRSDEPDTGRRPERWIGGFRIRKIADYAHTDDPRPRIRTFHYKKDLDSRVSSGIRRQLPSLSHVSYLPPEGQASNPLLTRTSEIRSGRLSGGPYYTKVIVTEGSGSKNGWTVHTFLDPGPLDRENTSPDYYPFPRAEDRSAMLGKADEVKVYDAEGRLLQSTAYRYRYDNYEGPPAHKFAFIGWGRRGQLSDYRKVPIATGSSLVRPSAMIECSYGTTDDDIKTCRTTTYHYDNDEHLQRTRTMEQLESPDRKKVTRTYYPGDRPGAQGDPLLQARHVLNLPLEQVTWFEEKGQKYLYSAEKTEYNGDIFVDARKSILRNGRHVYKGDHPEELLPLYREEENYLYQDEQGRPGEVERKYGNRTAYIWSHAQGLPTLIAEQAHREELETVLGSTLIEKLQGTTAGAKDLRTAIALLNTEKPHIRAEGSLYNDNGQPTVIVDANGRVRYFHYDCLHRPIRISDEKGHILKAYSYGYEHRETPSSPCSELEIDY